MERSAIYCGHANENPSYCDCPPDCFCQTRTCKNRIPVTMKPIRKPSPMKQVGRPEDVPMGHHYAVIIYKTSSYSVPGDERSRTNPGHGYPEHTVTSNDFEHWVTEDKSEWEEFVKNTDARMATAYSRHPFVFFEVTRRGKLEKTVTLKVE